MRIVVIGATGFVGRRLVGDLIAGGHDVTAMTRDVDKAQLRLPVRCRCVAWNPAVGVLDAESLRHADAVINLAGEGVADARWSAARKSAIHESRVLGTRLLVDSIAALPPEERPRSLISASAIGYYGDRGDEHLDEQSPAGTGFLAQVCTAWERETLRAGSRGLRVAVIRVGIVLGTQGGALRQMLLPFRLGLGGRLGSGKQWMSWIHLTDLTRLLRFAAENHRVSGILNGVAPAPATNTEFTRALARVLRRPALLPVPSIALRLALGEMASLLLGSQRVQPRAAEQFGFQFEHRDLSLALAELCADLSEHFEVEQWVPQPPETVFPFFADAHNLETLTPAFLRFRVLNVSTPALGDGTRITYRLSLHGVPLRWQSRIESWEPNRAFVDTQTSGPYASWHHTHEFEPHAGGTIIRDRVCYALPLAPLGALVAGRLVEHHLHAIFAYRRAQVAAIFGRQSK